MGDPIETYKEGFDRVIKFRLRLIELFILTVTVGVYMASTPGFKLMIIPVVMVLIGTFITFGYLIVDLSRTRTNVSDDDINRVEDSLGPPLTVGDFFPLTLYLFAIFTMMWVAYSSCPQCFTLRGMFGTP